MKLKVNRQEMADALSALTTIASSRSPKEVLKCVRVEAQPDVLLMSATDLEVGFRSALTQVEVDQTGESLVVADTLSRIVRECTDEVLVLEQDDRLLHVRGEGSHFQIVTQDPQDFPPVPVMEDDPDMNVEQEQLHRMVELTAFAAARESTRYAINGVLWEREGDKLTMAATDGRRLAVITGPVEGKDGSAKAIVPVKALTLLARLPIVPETRTGVKFLGNQVLLNMGRAMLSTSLVEGQFPSYRDVIPGDCDRRAKINRTDMLSALRRAALLTNEESKGVRFSFTEGTLTLTSRAPEQGEAEVVMPVEYHDEPLEIGFNPAFLIDVLRVADEDELIFELKEPNRPGVIRMGKDYVYVVMPVNLGSA
ncbi:MAG: DNA polymerase III subunit beta [Planctomycetota bacterium]|nr:MAG: DNA polymerase III subunit beta [Planctomycetota bacterium]